MDCSQDGFQWTAGGDLQRGLPTLGLINPPSNVADFDTVYDVAVIGAGYAGLIAARNLAIRGHRVLLLEARDRIGGRTWSSNLDGYPYELGGTWIHWQQPFVWAELSRYDMQDDIENSHDLSKGVRSWALITNDGRKSFSREEEAEITAKAMQKFVNVDGKMGMNVIPRPYQPFFNRDFAHFERMSFKDRLKELGSDLTRDERNCLEGFLSITSGGTIENSSFGEMLRWWALNSFDMQRFMEMCLTYKLKSGQSAFARKFFDEALTSKNLTYALRNPVQRIVDNGDLVTITTENARPEFKARKVICTVPLNVLNDIEFSPPLSSSKVDIANAGHVNKVSKVHVACENPELRSFSGTVANPHGRLTYVFGDGTTPRGETHLVSFGCSYEGVQLHPEDDISITVDAFKAFAPDMKPTRVVFHNWTRDRFAKGAWEWLRPGMMGEMDEMRASHGNIHFASADWARLWRGFIDGALEDGVRVAEDVHRELNVL